MIKVTLMDELDTIEEIRELRDKQASGTDRMMDNLVSEIIKQPNAYDNKGMRYTNYVAPDNVEYGRHILDSISGNHIFIETFKLKGSNPKYAILYPHPALYVRRTTDILLTIYGPMLELLHGDFILVVPDYKTIPINTYEDSIEDVLDTLDFIRALGYDNKHIVGWGESSAGHTILTTAYTMKQRNIDPLSCIVMLCPHLDLSCSTPSYIKNLSKDGFVTPKMMRFIHGAFALRNKDAAGEEYDILSKDLNGLPDMYFHYGTDERILDDYKRLISANYDGNIEGYIYPNMWHNFQCSFQLKSTMDSYKHINKFLSDHLK